MSNSNTPVLASLKNTKAPKVNSNHATGIKDSSTPRTTVVMRRLKDDRCAPEWLYTGVLERIREVIGGMQPGTLYWLEDLVGSDYWHRLSRGDRRTGGRCVPDMLSCGLLPEIEIAEAKRTSRIRYRLKH